MPVDGDGNDRLDQDELSRLLQSIGQPPLSSKEQALVFINQKQSLRWHDFVDRLLLSRSSDLRGSISSLRCTPQVLVIFAGVLNLGNADARGTLARESQQFITGDFVTQFLGNQGCGIGTHGLQHLLFERRISRDMSKKLLELVRAHAVLDVVLILTGLVVPLVLTQADWEGPLLSGARLSINLAGSDPGLSFSDAPACGAELLSMRSMSFALACLN